MKPELVLEFDAGNTRIKWRLLEQGAAGARKCAAGAVQALEKEPGAFIELGAQLESLPLARVGRVRAASVRGELFCQALTALLREKWGLQTEFARVSQRHAGFSSAYTPIGKLGVDRWLAMLAAWRACPGALCVVDLGSAITVDLVDAQGRHQGGHIAPGLETMRGALGGKSRALLARQEARWDGLAPAFSTAEGVESGILACVVGLLREVRQRHGGARHWTLTGGDAAILSPWLDWPHEIVADLVLDGLAIAMDGE